MKTATPEKLGLTVSLHPKLSKKADGEPGCCAPVTIFQKNHRLIDINKPLNFMCYCFYIAHF